MTDQMNANLLSLGDSELTLASKDEDIRGRTVLDSAGQEIGDVDDLMIDDDGAKVRFLRVAAGGFLGIGEKTFLVPVDAITQIDDKHVHVDQTREHVVGGPEYDPAMTRDQNYWADTYTHYGYGPFWAPGYTYPAFPYYGSIAPDRRPGV